MLLAVSSSILLAPPHSAIVNQAIAGKSFNQRVIPHQNWSNLLADVNNSKIKFQIKWVKIDEGIYQKLNYPIDRPYPIPIPPLGETHSPSIYELRVFILNPSKAYWLSSVNDQRVLDELVKLLDNPNQGWAANVVLSKMMGITGMSSKIDEVSPSQWWEADGKTGKSKKEWSIYLQKVRPTMRWSILGGYYQHQTPDGKKIY